MSTVAWNPPVEWVKEQIEKAGTTIGSVHFTKRENGELRKMSYRLHVKAPSVAKAPKGISKDSSVDTIQTIKKTETYTVDVCTKCGLEKTGALNTSAVRTCNTGPFRTETKTRTIDATIVVPAKPKLDKKRVDKANDQITVLDANKVVRDDQGNIIGRGAWRTIPLENVVRIKAKGEEIVINRY